MPYLSSTPFLTPRRRLAVAAVAAAAGPLLTADARAAYTYTNVDAEIRGSIGTTTTASRTLAVNSSGELQGEYQATGNSTRVYYTLAPGSTTITPYPTVGGTQLGYFAAAPASLTFSGGGALLNDPGTFLASASSSATVPQGSYSPGTSTFTPIPIATNYNGTFTNPITTATNGTTTTQAQSSAGTNPLPYAINGSGVIVGVQNYTVANTTPNIGTLGHGFVYNPTTGATTDLGGGQAGGSAATGFSQLVGIANNNTVVGDASVANATFRETTTDAVVGTPADAALDGYAFTDLASLISPLATAAGGTYLTSFATNVSPNGTYVVGSYTEKAGTMTFTRSFEFNDVTNAIVDLGSLATTATATNLLDADAVNDLGNVVGQGSAGGVTHGFLYSNSTGGTLYDLNTLAPTTGVVYASAYGINDDGTIVGFDNATGSGGVATSAYALTGSVPEPTSAGLAVAAGGLVLGRRRRSVAKA